MRIFIALGSQKFQLNRLLKEMDDCLIYPNTQHWEVFAQTGSSSYRPQRYAYTNFLSKEEYEKQISDADLMIVHGGAGTIMSGLEQGKRIIVYPRKKCFHEHIDDHQSEIAQVFQKRGMVFVCDGGNLKELISAAVEHNFHPYHPAKSIIPEILRTYLLENCK